VVVDGSIINARELEISNEVDERDSAGDRAFDNKTDLKNEDFIFVH
jgi:hypothetical protein